MSVTREQVIAKAREYIGTPLDHQGRRKGANGRIDCVGVVLCVAEELGILDKDGAPLGRNDHLNYGPQPHGKLVHETTKTRLVMKWEASDTRPMPDLVPGDVVTLRNPRAACHAGILTSINGRVAIVHAYPSGTPKPCVVEHVLNAKWISRIEGIFTFPGVG